MAPNEIGGSVDHGFRDFHGEHIFPIDLKYAASRFGYLMGHQPLAD